MRAPTLRAFQWLHTWAGICAGFALFIAFVGGTLTMFQEEIGHWERPLARHLAIDGGPAQRLVGTLVALHPRSADDFGIVLASETHREPFVYWKDGGEWREARLAEGGRAVLDTSLGFDDFSTGSLGAADEASAAAAAAAARARAAQAASAASAASASGAAANGEAGNSPPEPFDASATMVDHDTLDLSTAPGLADFVNRLHYSLALSEFGRYVMGVVALMFGVTLVSGFAIHLPRLTRDLFALRPGSNLKLFWQDTHNAVGVLALPFHAAIALTGSVLCLGLVAMMLFNTIAFDGRLVHEITAMRTAVPSGPVVAVPGAPLPVDQLVARARAEVPGFAPRWIAYTRYGADDGSAEVWGESERALGSLGSVRLRLNDGVLLARQTAAARDTNHAVSSAIYGLHFGSYGGLAVRWIYFVLGVAGATLTFTGNLLWIEARRRRASAEQSMSTRNVSRATVAICIGTCMGIAAAFDAALLFPSAEASTVYGLALVIAVLWSFARAPIVAARDLLLTTSLCCIGIPLLNALLTQDNLVHSMMNGDWSLAGIDLGGLAFGTVFMAAAVLTHRRGYGGEPFSVWAMQR